MKQALLLSPFCRGESCEKLQLKELVHGNSHATPGRGICVVWALALVPSLMTALYCSVQYGKGGRENKRQILGLKAVSVEIRGKP
jgi:hypothetical protein